MQDVAYFIERFENLLPFQDYEPASTLEDEFIQYQLLNQKDIPQYVWNDAICSTSGEKDYYRMDKIWAHIASLKCSVTQTPKFEKLSKVAKLVLTLPHSNADEERVFNIVGHNKTETRRNRLRLEGTLSSILTLKRAVFNQNPCYSYDPPSEVEKSSKSATYRYNTARNKK